MKALFRIGLITLIALKLLEPKPLFAQLQGSYGDPVINITFGAGPGFGQPFANLSGYTFDNADCPNDGHYTIAPSTYNCFGSSWHTLNRDHTGDPNGRMLIVNASYSPGIFYKETVAALCPNTTYSFTAWCLNLITTMNTIEPNITFSIQDTEGNILRSQDSGNIPVTATPQWKQYGFVFSTPANVSNLVLVITNNAPGGIGNDIAVDDIVFRPWSPEINVNSAANDPNLVACEGQTKTVQLSATLSPGFVDPMYQWQNFENGAWKDIPGFTGISEEAKITGIAGQEYKYRLAVTQHGANSASCRVYSDSVVVPVSLMIKADAGKDRTVFQGTSFELESKVSGATSYNMHWEPQQYLADVNGKTICTPLEDITYTLIAESTDGCNTYAEDQVHIHVNKKLVVPNTFTPNGDGINDKWEVAGLNTYLNCSVVVFNRYGQAIFKSKGYEHPWDGNYNGKPIETGSYMYVIDPGNGDAKFSGWLFVAK
ncbi:T9SS type B sorting domain-containing protein [Pedobacter sp. HMF7647]|uniref:T9SS type B sorting domain-containing protein n=1 Tax=Hufsiella arboris TaxID=2695275 RepID=A0A7K1YDL9_9SPHI|nr:gliding motility-associated C-terminal domain-containing protein [Hufsiella arboris]MXV52696.1 T9SS type B sorting domain-containing protein [Hufsiella arboris]